MDKTWTEEEELLRANSGPGQGLMLSAAAMCLHFEVFFFSLLKVQTPESKVAVLLLDCLETDVRFTAQQTGLD